MAERAITPELGQALEASVRKAEGIGAGDVVEVVLEV